MLSYKSTQKERDAANAKADATMIAAGYGHTVGGKAATIAAENAKAQDLLASRKRG